MKFGRESLAALGLFVYFCSLASSAFPVSLAAPGLTEAPRLAAIYDTILRAQFAQADDQITRACPPAPTEACSVLRTVSLWWQVLMDPESRALDDRLQRETAATIATAEAWTRREPKRAEAFFYLAASYGPLVQWRVQRGQNISAARDGNRIRVALEKAIALDSSLVDAYFGIGMYHYYADVAPAAAKLLRILLFLPGGDREKGLSEMLRAREQGVLVAGEADYQLHWLYLWYEQQPEHALQLVKGLSERYPTNPVFFRRIAEIQSSSLKDHRASAAAWEVLLARAQQGHVERAPIAEVFARLGLSNELQQLSQFDRSIEVLQPLIAARPSAPYAAAGMAQLLLGLAHDRMGHHDLAVAAFNQAIALAPSDDATGLRRRARDELRRTSSKNFF